MAVPGADLVLDGIVGISGRGALREPAARLVTAAEHAGVPVLAVDLPSGVDPDTGAVEGPAVTAAATVTFGALKPVHVLAAARCGPVHLVDIGLGPVLPDPHAHVLDAARRGRSAGLRPVRPTTSTRQGVVGIAAGSATYPGAAVLATGAAVLATSGMVRFAGGAAPGVRDRWPEVVTTGSIEDAGRVQAWAVGPGIGTDEAGSAVLAAAIAAEVPLCVDADAITLLADHEDLRDALRGRPVVVTPHDREFARVAGDVGGDRIGAARRAAADLGVTVLLKGNATVVADAGRAGARAPVDVLVGGHGRVRRRPHRHHRCAARRRASIRGGPLVARRTCTTWRPSWPRGAPPLPHPGCRLRSPLRSGPYGCTGLRRTVPGPTPDRWMPRGGSTGLFVGAVARSPGVRRSGQPGCAGRFGCDD